ncbi:MAG: hypothetical protein QXI09_03505 [Candidatus Aenigmatarchaeota archaeon]
MGLRKIGKNFANMFQTMFLAYKPFFQKINVEIMPIEIIDENELQYIIGVKIKFPNKEIMLKALEGG